MGTRGGVFNGTIMPRGSACRNSDLYPSGKWQPYYPGIHTGSGSTGINHTAVQYRSQIPLLPKITSKKILFRLSRQWKRNGHTAAAIRLRNNGNGLNGMVERGRLKMRDMKIRDGQKCRTWKCETWICGTNLQGWKMRDMKMRDQIAGVENAGKVSMESQSVSK